MDVRIVKRVLEYQKGYFCEWDVFYSPNTLFSREKRDTIGGTRIETLLDGTDYLLSSSRERSRPEHHVAYLSRLV
jgi:hypothetical protein